MAITEGTLECPSDNTSVKMLGFLGTDGNLYLPRLDGLTSKNLKVALFAANGDALLTTGAPGVVQLQNNDSSTPPAPTHPSILATSTVALAANANRVYARFINDSDTVIYLMEGAAAVVGQGVRLNALGGSYEMAKAFGNLYIGTIYAIAATAGGKNLLVGEAV